MITHEELSTVSANTDKYVTRFEENFAFKRLVTPSEARTMPIYNWFIYPHSFSPSLVRHFIKEFELTSKSRVYDPFVGAGTTLLCAKQEGISAIGLDLLPVSAGLTQAKVTTYDVDALNADVNAIAEIISQKGFVTTTPNPNDPLIVMAENPITIISRAFDMETLHTIINIKRAIRDVTANVAHREFLLVGLLALLEKYSATEKTGGWLKMVEMPQHDISLADAYLERLRVMFIEIQDAQKAMFAGEWQVEVGDAREVHPSFGKFDAIISSPPYLNRHDYTRVLSIELLVGFVDLYAGMQPLRHNLLRSHVEAKPRPIPPLYKKPSKLVAVIEELRRRKTEQRLMRIVEGYFEDMFLVLQSAQAMLKPEGHVAFVLGNVRFSGYTIPVDELIAEIGETVGLQWERIVIARTRNNSAQQMRDYGREPSRESIIIWRGGDMRSITNG